MDAAEIEPLLRDLESDRVERKERATDTDKLAQAVCAFANDMSGHGKPGYLIVGARDDGTPCGLEVTDRLLLDLAALRADGNIQPLPAISVEKVVVRGGDLAVVKVQPSDLPPVRYKDAIWIRVGPRRARASEQEERILVERRTSKVKTWDARPCVGATLTDLALDLFAVYRSYAVARDIIAENHRDLPLQLAALHFFDMSTQCPTHAGILAFGTDIIRSMPGAYVQVVWYSGEDKGSDFHKEKRISGDLRTVLDGLRTLAADLAEQRPIQHGARETGGYAYPPGALFELFMNAVIHRNYESNTPVMINCFVDRLEVSNPGGLYDMSPEQFPHATGYRNPIIAEAARTLGFINRFGFGIEKAQSLLRRNGSPEAIFKFAGHFLATIRKRP